MTERLHDHFIKNQRWNQQRRSRKKQILAYGGYVPDSVDAMPEFNTGLDQPGANGSTMTEPHANVNAATPTAPPHTSNNAPAAALEASGGNGSASHAWNPLAPVSETPDWEPRIHRMMATLRRAHRERDNQQEQQGPPLAANGPGTSSTALMAIGATRGMAPATEPAHSTGW